MGAIYLLTQCRSFGLHFCRRQYGSIFNHFEVISPTHTEFGKIMQNNGYYAVQVHSKSPISVPTERL